MPGERAEIKIRRLSVMQDWSEGLILNYRLGGKTQYPKQCLIKVMGAELSYAKRMIGLKVGWPVDDPKICGKIIGVHGRTGTLRVRFNRGVPGQALGTRVRIFE